MEIIPEEWSVGLISPFLIGLSRDSLHTSRSAKLRKNLMRAENIKVSVSIRFLVMMMMNSYLIDIFLITQMKKGFISYTAKPVTITEET